MSSAARGRKTTLGILGATSASGMAVGAALSAALVGGGSAGAASPVEAHGQAAALRAFDGCEQLRRWYVRAALPRVGPWGLGLPPVAFSERSTGGPVALAQGRSIPAAGGSASGTNVQEPSVDESDVAKTDGRVVVRVDGGDLVVTDVTGEPRELSRIPLPGPPLVHPELLLRGDRVLVVGDEQAPVYGGPLGGARRNFLPVPQQETRARLLSFDLTDPSSPRLTDARTIDGGAVSARQYPDGTVRIVVATGFPPLDFVSPDRDRTAQEAARLNRAIVRKAPVTAWLPGLRTSSEPSRQPLVDCDAVRHPRAPSGLGTISVLTFPLDEPTAYTATAVTASGDLAYSSAHRLYVATTHAARTDVHAFALDGRRTTYTASGSLRGTAKDRWSFSEYRGHLRVVTAIGSGWNPRDNVVTVLDEVGGRLRRIGSIGGLGQDEAVESVRWFGDLAVIVTFRRTDPLFTVDLSDPQSPRLLGTLRVPGYSEYLHPVGDGLLVGVGRNVSVTGEDRGAQAATFDLRDLSHVRRPAAFPLGDRTDVAAGWDPRTFTYLPGKHILVVPVRSWADLRARFVALRVSRDGSLDRAGTWVARGYADEDLRSLSLGGGRVALVGDSVRVVRVG